LWISAHIRLQSFFYVIPLVGNQRLQILRFRLIAARALQEQRASKFIIRQRNFADVKPGEDIDRVFGFCDLVLAAGRREGTAGAMGLFRPLPTSSNRALDGHSAFRPLSDLAP
jgi:hypothetical protein